MRNLNEESKSLKFPTEYHIPTFISPTIVYAYPEQFLKPKKFNTIYSKKMQTDGNGIIDKQQRFLRLQKKMSKSIFKNKKDEQNNITYQYFQDIIISLAKEILYKHNNTLVDRIIKLVDQYFQNQNQVIWKFLTILQIKKDTFDIGTSFQQICIEVNQFALTKDSVIRIIIQDIWYDYLEKKYDQEKYFNSKQKFKKDFRKDLEYMIQFISDLILCLFKNWFYVYQKKIRLFDKICEELGPMILTSSKKWLNIYGKILKMLGKCPLKILRSDKNINFFLISHQYQFPQNEKPFHQTIRALKQYYNQYQISKKIQKLLKISSILKNQVKKYIRKKQKQRPSQIQDLIDIDNQIAVFQYCILKSERNGIFESLEYLQLFYEQSQKYTINYLQRLNIPHLIATLKMSVLKLKQRDQFMDLKQSLTKSKLKSSKLT